MTYVGIDPGLHGGIAIIDKPDPNVYGKIFQGSTSLITIHKMPETTKDLSDLIGTLPRSAKILMESQGARPAYARKKNEETGQDETVILRGVNATWTFAQHYGELRGILAALDLSYETIRPHDWQSALGIPKKHKGENNTAWKNRLKAKAQELFPNIKVTKDLADALLIAEACRRFHQGGSWSHRQPEPSSIWDDF